MAGAQSIGQGIQNFSDQYAKFKEETDLLKAKTKAFEDMIKTNPDLFGLNDPDKLKAFTDQAPNESLRQKNARLSQFMEATMTQKVMEKGQREAAQQEQQRRIGEQQLRAGQQAMAQNAFIMQNQQRKAAEEAQLKATLDQNIGLSNQLNSGVGTGVLRPEVQSNLTNNPFLKANIQLRQAGASAPTADQLMDFVSKQSTAGGGSTAAMKDTDAVISAELQSGKLLPAGVAARRAELLAGGGRDQGERYDTAPVHVRKITGGDARMAVKERGSGRVGFVDSKTGKFEPLDPTEWRASTLTDVNSYMDPPQFEKLRDKLLSDEKDVRQIAKYLEGSNNLEQGAGLLADKIMGKFKTIFTQEPLTEKEKAVGIQTGRLQQLLGGLRTTVVGPGVMTEIDAQRIINAVGGDISITTNKDVMKQLVNEILTHKLRTYQSDLKVYNGHVLGRYGTAGYEQLPEFKAFTEPTGETSKAAPVPLVIKSVKRL